MAKIRIGLFGYGNLSRGIECAIRQNDDVELACVFTRRDPSSLKIASDAPVYASSDMEAHADEVDVLVVCGGSAFDLPEQTPACARYFNVVDSFDTHAHIPEHFDAVDEALKTSGHVGLISIGWDPGLFSLMRLMGASILPDGKSYTFWGKGVSQGHSDAIRNIAGVKNGKQYTIPVPEALEAVRAGQNPDFTPRQMHTRECFVVAEEGADTAAIEQAIVTMPNYFDEYDTTVHFISQEEFDRDHAGIPHGGFAMRSGSTGDGSIKHLMEFSLKLDSNPEFTASVLLAYARATARLASEGQTGCKTIFDVPPAYLSPEDGAYLRAHLL